MTTTKLEGIIAKMSLTVEEATELAYSLLHYNEDEEQFQLCFCIKKVQWEFEVKVAPEGGFFNLIALTMLTREAEAELLGDYLDDAEERELEAYDRLEEWRAQEY